jgi:hypothetical protein
MAKWADYCISKQTLVDGWIDHVITRKDLGETIHSETFERNRQWMVQQVSEGKTFCSIKKNDNGGWNLLGKFTYDGKKFSWVGPLPKNLTMRKTFISYYHKDDQIYRQKFENLFGDLIISKSVDIGDIEADSGDDYIKQLIQRDYLRDTSVIIVLVGPKTKCRKHVDWEISAGISSKVGGNSGLIGILLPEHPDYGEGKKWAASNLPFRLAANLESGYAKLYDWTEDRVMMQNWIELAFARKGETDKVRNNGEGLNQMERDICS